MLPCTQKLSGLTWKPKGVILSGSPYSVYDADAPHVDPAVFDLEVFFPFPFLPFAPELIRKIRYPFSAFVTDYKRLPGTTTKT